MKTCIWAFCTCYHFIIADIFWHVGITEKTTGLSAHVNTNDFAMYDAFLHLLDFKLRRLHVRDDWYFCVVSSIYALDIIIYLHLQIFKVIWTSTFNLINCCFPNLEISSSFWNSEDTSYFETRIYLFSSVIIHTLIFTSTVVKADFDSLRNAYESYQRMVVRGSLILLIWWWLYVFC